MRSQGSKWWVRTENGMTRQWAVKRLKEVKEESVKTESEDRIQAWMYCNGHINGAATLKRW